MSDVWKISLPVTKADAETLSADLPAFAHLDPTPTLVTTEVDPATPDDHRLDVYIEGEPEPEFIVLLTELLPTSPRVEPLIELVPDEDWVTKSQEGLDPIRAGRFFVHTARDADAVPPDAIPLRIEAGLAFGTGHHPTTAGCLRAIDALETPPRNVLDLGTGTALLALGVVKLFPDAKVIASDIDAVSIDVARENIEVNGETVGERVGELALVVADGMAADALQRRAPFDVIIANILAGPLIEMAADIARAIAPGGLLILAGLLRDQEHDVVAAYTKTGLTHVASDPNEGWPVVTLTRSAG
ncbi:MAG: 50S ribosomal protein L11 methyltransferase [Pacificimonas sp.]